MDYIIIAVSEIKKEAGSYPYGIVLAFRPNAPIKNLPFVTWMAVMRNTDDPSSGDFSQGHYDMSLTEASISFQSRCKSYGLGLGQAFGPAIKELERR